jgi:hypothetical protein
VTRMRRRQCPVKRLRPRSAACRLTMRCCVGARLLARPRGLVGEMPHFIWHYLADADIRSRDEAYRRSQERDLEAVLPRLQCGDAA